MAIQAGLATAVLLNGAMILLAVRLSAHRGRVSSMASALRHLMMQTRAERGCARCELSTDLVDPAILYYVEEWAGESDLRDQIRSERFRQLIEVMETAAHPPRFIVQRVIVACGFDYVQAALREHQS